MEEGCAIAGIDHVVVGVGDLEAARRAWIDLGFTVTPRGRHSDWGTANYCVMFAEDYVELLGIADPSRPSNNLRVFLESREGLFGLAFASDDAAAVAQALREGGIAGAGVEELSRSLELPTGEVAPSFRLVHLPPATTPGLSAFVCQHMTPELVGKSPGSRIPMAPARSSPSPPWSRTPAPWRFPTASSSDSTGSWWATATSRWTAAVAPCASRRPTA